MQRPVFILLLGFISILIVSCSKTDTTEPFSYLISPVPGAYFLTSDSIHLEATFTDDEALSQYRVEVKGNFGGQQTALSPWQPVFVYDLEGSEETVERYISMPDTIATGWYLFIIKAVDARGNQSGADTSPVFIQNALDVIAPVIDISSPAEGITINASDSIVLSAIISDNLKLFKLSVTISSLDEAIQLHSVSVDHPGNPYEHNVLINNIDTLSGWFRLSIFATDSMNNGSYAERNFLIQ